MQSPNEFSPELDSPNDSDAKKKASLRLSAMNVLAMREHSRFELEQKLKKKSEDSTLITAVLNALESDNLLCDPRFADIFIRSKANNGFGPYKIKQELQAKGVSKNIVSDAMAALDIDWFIAAKELYKKRVAKLQEIDLKERQKQSRYLLNRGFSGEITHRVVGDYE